MEKFFELLKLIQPIADILIYFKNKYPEEYKNIIDDIKKQHQKNTDKKESMNNYDREAKCSLCACRDVCYILKWSKKHLKESEVEKRDKDAETCEHYINDGDL